MDFPIPPLPVPFRPRKDVTKPEVVLDAAPIPSVDAQSRSPRCPVKSFAMRHRHRFGDHHRRRLLRLRHRRSSVIVLTPPYECFSLAAAAAVVVVVGWFAKMRFLSRKIRMLYVSSCIWARRRAQSRIKRFGDEQPSLVVV